MVVSEPKKYLSNIISSIDYALAKPDLSTSDFVKVCNEVIPIFDILGSVFHFARKEFETKNDSLHTMEYRFSLLKDIVLEDEKNGTVTKKNSLSRNLHRLMSAILFMEILISEITKSTTISLKDAAMIAYETALAPIHTKIIRAVVNAGLMTLPDRNIFLKGLNETEESALEQANKMIPLINEIISKIQCLYTEPMPPSNSWFVSA